jgi:hypothetical protein
MKGDFTMAKSNLNQKTILRRETRGWFYTLMSSFLLAAGLLATAPKAKAEDFVLYPQRGCEKYGICSDAPDPLEYGTRNGLYTPVGNDAEIIGDAFIYGANVWLQNKREKRYFKYLREKQKYQQPAYQEPQPDYRYENDDEGGGYGNANTSGNNDENWLAVDRWPRKCNGRVYRDYRWKPDGHNRKVISDACVLDNNRVHAFADPDTGQIYKWHPIN